MSIVPNSHLSAADRARLGNNLPGDTRHRRPHGRHPEHVPRGLVARAPRRAAAAAGRPPAPTAGPGKAVPR